MQLKKIKLAGFKSFVDPTTVLIPSSLVAIVGPNGCGKSNIIDAVCWVMGESSAKYLRGESLTDVIFNGSTARKPVGQASVELIFDNQDASLGGEYASYAEISIRRQITRDSESSYFLNGVRCRRRDIIDIFLGTGLGPRSYSIIGQNMISRLIEAKPDDMRIYLEEAAGVSKYKERRRETENRIQHTKDNLARLDDVRAELEKQINTLKRQATAAEKFKLLKQEERLFRGQWLVVQWRQYDTRLVEETLQIQQQATGLEARQTELGEISLQLEYKREAQQETNEIFQEVQRRYYTIGNDITRLEQEVRHHQERRTQWQMDIQQADRDLSEVKNACEEAEEESHELAQEIMQLEPQLLAARELAEESTHELSQVENAMQEWQNQWDEFNQLAAKNTQIAEVEQTRIQHLEQKIQTNKQRLIKQEQEEALFDFSKIDQEISELSQQVSEVTEQVEENNQQLTDAREQISSQQSMQQQLSQRLDQIRNELQRARGQQASLEALQQTALGQRNKEVIKWLAEHKLDKHPRLAQGIEVESSWEYAVEKVLGAHLQAVCVDELSEFAAVVDQFKAGSLSVCAKQTSSSSLEHKPNALLNKVKSQWPVESLLANVFTAESLDEAFAISKTLNPQESVITRDGTWLGNSWLHLTRDDDPEAGVFQREQELKQLAQKIAELTATQEQLESDASDNRELATELENQRDALQKIANQYHAKLAELQAQQKMKNSGLVDLRARAERFCNEKRENTEQLEQAQIELIKVRTTWQQAMSDLEHHAEQREALVARRDSSRDQLQAARNKVNQVKDNVHQIEIRLQTTKSQHAALRQTIVRMHAQMSSLVERKATLEKELASAFSTESLEKDLTTALAHRLTVEDELNTARNNVEAVQQSLHALEMKRQEIEREIALYRDMLETLRVEQQGIKVKSETILEQIKEAGFQLEEILKELPENSVADELHAELEQITQRINRLGPINLVAIEEYAACAERKEYLDKQQADLQEGLTTLENAIAKIDKETRARFKETFDKVNERFQELFPKVFGGGRAYLELTGENLLDTGVAVMACPPGKRNSTIHLLSGGEKAMTAIALVFSIFHLNPAPFCLLDEVDAPLDDANIGRYCQLVQSMSDKTQFIFISHNKLAIEMGQHLMGVTMHEPGVSRLVSVDVQEAVTLAGA